MTEAEYKTLIITEVDAGEFQADIDTLWDSWWSLDGSDVNTDAAVMELRLKRRLLLFLQGRYHKRYNVTIGTEKRDAEALWKHITAMLGDVDSQLSLADSGAGVPILGIGRLGPGVTVGAYGCMSKTNCGS